MRLIRRFRTSAFSRYPLHGHNLDRTGEDLLAGADDEEREAQQADERIARPFECEDRLAALVRRLEEIDAELTPDEEPLVADTPSADATVVRAPSADVDVGL